jgi:hypothetical protein
MWSGRNVEVHSLAKTVELVKASGNLRWFIPVVFLIITHFEIVDSQTTTRYNQSWDKFWLFASQAFLRSINKTLTAIGHEIPSCHKNCHKNINRNTIDIKMHNYLQCISVQHINIEIFVDGDNFAVVTHADNNLLRHMTSF